MKTHLLILTFLLAVLHCNAQITLTGYYNFDQGFSDTFIIDQSEFDLLNEGENQIWDASQASGLEFTNDYVSVFDTPFSSNYPEANVAISSQGFYAYFNSSAEQLVNYGFVVQEFLTAEYTDPLIQAQYPMDYGESFSDSFSGDMYLLANEIGYERYGEVTITADAWGDLILPYDTIENTLRIKTEVMVVDSLDGEGFNAIETIYTWFSQEVGTSLASYSIAENEGQAPVYNFSFLTLEEFTSVMETELENELLIFPNPANNFVQISGINSGETYKIINNQGQEVKSGIINGDERIYLDELSSGIYFLHSIKGKTVLTEKFIVK